MSRPLFDNMFEVGENIGRAPSLLLCVDFDGTLATIVDDPAQVNLSPQVQRVLWSLSSFEDTFVAVLSGRERADVQARVGIPNLICAGNHGLEISGPGFRFLEPNAVTSRTALQQLAAELAECLQSIAGVVVEDKGLTISVHYRLAEPDEREEVHRIVHAALAQKADPFRLTLGDMVYQVRPCVDWNKGVAVQWIKEQIGKPDALVVYVGDDVTDEDAFASLPDSITVKVGNGAPTAARYHVEGPADVRRFLEWSDLLLRKKTVSV
jgi:trehalose-phosphatase